MQTVACAVGMRITGRRFGRHADAPAKGDRAIMIGEARRLGCADRIHDGHEWVVDPLGRPLEHSAWVAQ